MRVLTAPCALASTAPRHERQGPARLLLPRPPGGGKLLAFPLLSWHAAGRPCVPVAKAAPGEGTGNIDQSSNSEGSPIAGQLAPPVPGRHEQRHLVMQAAAVRRDLADLVDARRSFHSSPQQRRHVSPPPKQQQQAQQQAPVGDQRLAQQQQQEQEGAPLPSQQQHLQPPPPGPPPLQQQRRSGTPHVDWQSTSGRHRNGWYEGPSGGRALGPASSSSSGSSSMGARPRVGVKLWYEPPRSSRSSTANRSSRKAASNPAAVGAAPQESASWQARGGGTPLPFISVDQADMDASIAHTFRTPRSAGRPGPSASTSGSSSPQACWPPAIKTATNVLVVSAALINRHNQVLLAKRVKGNAKFRGMYEFPGGKVEPGEIPQYALQRELHEELGVEVEERSLQALTFVSHRYGYWSHNFLALLFVAEEWRNEPWPKEGQELEWVHCCQLMSYASRVPQPTKRLLAAVYGVMLHRQRQQEAAVVAAAGQAAQATTGRGRGRAMSSSGREERSPLSSVRGSRHVQRHTASRPRQQQPRAVMSGHTRVQPQRLRQGTDRSLREGQSRHSLLAWWDRDKGVEEGGTEGMQQAALAGTPSSSDSSPAAAGAEPGKAAGEQQREEAGTPWRRGPYRSPSSRLTLQQWLGKTAQRKEQALKAGQQQQQQGGGQALPSAGGTKPDALLAGASNPRQQQSRAVTGAAAVVEAPARRGPGDTLLPRRHDWRAYRTRWTGRQEAQPVAGQAAGAHE